MTNVEGNYLLCWKALDNKGGMFNLNLSFPYKLLIGQNSMALYLCLGGDQAEDTACLCCSLRGLVVRSTGRMRLRGEGSHAATTVTPLPPCHKNSFLSPPFLLRTWASHTAHGIFATCVDLILFLGLILLEGDKSPTLEDLSSACYWPSMLIFKVPGHAHIQVDDTPPHHARLFRCQEAFASSPAPVKTHWGLRCHACERDC